MCNVQVLKAVVSYAAHQLGGRDRGVIGQQRRVLKLHGWRLIASVLIHALSQCDEIDACLQVYWEPVMLDTVHAVAVLATCNIVPASLRSCAFPPFSGTCDVLLNVQQLWHYLVQPDRIMHEWLNLSSTSC